MKKDIISKEAILAITEDIAKLILNLNISEVKFVDKELKRIEKREADVVALCRIKNDAGDNHQQILHLEIQNNNDATMPLRMLRYYTDIQLQYPKLKINQYVIYIGKAKLSMPSRLQSDMLDYQYHMVDMHQIDCEALIKQDTPDALVLSILCDFKGKNELEVVTHITKRIHELTRENEHQNHKYMLMLDTLSENRNLKHILKEARDMLREINYESLPIYELGIERGIERGIEKGVEKGVKTGVFNTALMMINEFNLAPKDVANKLNISLEKLLEKLSQHK